MANTNQYCPVIHIGFGREIAQQINDMYGVHPDTIVSVLRRSYELDPSCLINSDMTITVDEFMNKDGIKQALSEYFGAGESTFVVDTEEEYKYFTEIYDRLLANHWIDDRGIVTVGGIKNIEDIERILLGKDWNETRNRFKKWYDANNNIHAAIPRPTLITTFKDKEAKEELEPINIYYGANENSELSNFAYRPFLIHGVAYRSVEQYFQYQKALLSKDYNTANEILSSKSPKQARILGRKVKNFNDSEWNKYSEDIMYDAILASFEQNEDALNILLSTGDRQLTHKQDNGKWGEAFPRLLMKAREQLRSKNTDRYRDPIDFTPSEYLNSLSKEEADGVADFIGMTPDVFEHNKQSVIEATERSLQDRQKRLEDLQKEDNKKTPIENFRRKFSDKNMLDFLTRVACRRISNIVSELQDDDSNRTAAKKYFGNSFTTFDFSRMPRQEILLNPDIFRAIWQNARYIDFSKTSTNNDPYLDDILEMIYDDQTDGIDNFILLLHNGRDILFRNEGIKFEYDGSIQRADEETSEDTQQADDDSQTQYEEGEGSDYESHDQYKLAEPSVPASRKITQRIKLMLENIPNVESIRKSNGEYILSTPSDPWNFGFNTFISPGRAVNTILNILSGADTIEEMIERLNSSKDAFPWLSAVIDRISNTNGTPLAIDKEKMRNDFFASFRKDKTIYTATVVTENPDGTKSYRYVEKNRGGSIRKNKQNLLSHFETKSGISLFKNGNIDFSSDSFNFALVDLFPSIIVNRQNPRIGGAWRELSERYEEDIEDLYRSVDRNLGNKQNIFSRIYNTLIDFGIECPISTFYAIAMADRTSGVERFEDTNIGKIAKLLRSISFQLTAFKKMPYYNPMDYQQYQEAKIKYPNNYVYLNPAYTELLEIINAFSESEVESVAHVNGKAHYAFNYPTFMQTTIAKLSNMYGSRERMNEFFEKRYNNDWYSYFDENGDRVYSLDILQKISEGRNVGRLEYLQKLDINGVDYKNMSPRSYAMAILSDYFSQIDKNTAVYRAPIASDKPAMDGIRWVKYNDRSDTESNFKKVITDQAWSIALQEIRRSREVLRRAIRGDSTIANYDIKLDSDEEKAQLNVIMDKMTSQNEKVGFQDLFVNGKYIFRRSGVGFKMIRFMQDVLVNNKSTGDQNLDKSRDDLRQAIIDSIFNGKDTIKDFSESFSNVFADFMNNRIMENAKYLQGIGVFDTIKIEDDIDGSKFDIYKHIEPLALNYAKERGLIQADQDGETPKYVSRMAIDSILDDMLEEFVYNNFIMQIQMAELFGVDLAFYNGTTDFQKRSAQTRSTGQKLNKYATIFGEPVSDGKFRTLTVKSVKHQSFQKSEIQNVLEIYANTIEDDQQRRVFIRSIPSIVDKYNKVDATDGQAWNCISSLRKKHIMAAQWTYEKDDARIGEKNEDGSIFLNEGSNTDEAVYKRMKLGKPLASDFFHVFTQVDKPFVYDVSVRDGMPVPVQQKNSEYTYVLVNQFMSTKRDDSPIAVIINVMERTFEKNSLTGLDTVNFDSAVKVGTREGIDLEQNLDDLREQLDKVLHLGENVKYNTYDEFIDEIDIDSYSYQQSNPEHFVDHRQLIGSQMKILALANTHDSDIFDVENMYTALKSIYDGDTISGKQLKELYFAIMRDRVLLGEKMLRDELSLDHSFRARTDAISDKAKSSFALNRKYNADDIRGVSSYKGSFLLAAEDPTQAENLKAVTSSWVRKAIYRQPILGGPIVQATNFGQKKELKTVIRNGIFKHFETIIPMPEQIRKCLLVDGTNEVDPKYYDVKNGVWNFPAIRSHLFDIGAIDMLNILLYRIPTEGKYSIFPAKVVGFVPNGGGSTVWLPQDGTTIAGFDFDIDKMFAVMKEYATQDGKMVLRHDNGNAVQYTLKAKSDYGKLAGYNNILFDLQWLSLTTMQSASEIFDPGNFDDLTDLSFQIELLRARDQNGSNIYTKEQVAAMNSNQLKEAWEDINDLNVSSLSTMVKLHHQNMANKDMLGIAAVANISHAQISMFTSDEPDIEKNKYNLQQSLPSKSVISIVWKDRLGRTRVHELQGSIPMDRLLDWNGELISKYLRKYIGAAADGAKNPTLSRLGVDKVTFPVIQWMLRAGIPMEIAHLFTSLPIFGRLSAKYQSMNDDEKTSVSRAIDELEYDIFKENRALFTGYSSAYAYRRAKYKNAKGYDLPMHIQLSDNELLEAIYNPSYIDNPMAQFHLLEEFRFLSSLANVWTTFSDYGRINSAVAGPKASIEENESRADKVKDVMDLFIGEHPQVIGMKFDDLQKAMPYETQMHDSIVDLLSAIQDDYFPSYQSNTYRSAIRTIELITGKKMSAETKEKLNQAQKMMALSLDGYRLGGMDFIQMYNPDEAKRFLLNFPKWYQRELNDLKLLTDDLRHMLENNLLLQLIGDPVSKTKSCPIDLLNTEIFGADEDYKYRITLSWLELMEYDDREEIGDKNNERVHNLAFELFRYFTLRNNGKAFNSKTPWHLAPLDLKLSIPGYNERLKSVASFETDDFLFSLQFLLNNVRDKNLVTQIDDSIFKPSMFNGPTGEIEVTEELAAALIADSKYWITYAGESLLKPIFYLGDNVVLILGTREDFKNGGIYADDLDSIPYHLVAGMGIPGVISEYYPYLRNSVFGYYSDETGEYEEPSDDINTLADFESRRSHTYKPNYGTNVNRILEEVLSKFGYKLSDVIDQQDYNMSVSRPRLRNYLKLTDGALLQRLGFKQSSEFNKDKDRALRFLEEVKNEIRKIC